MEKDKMISMRMSSDLVAKLDEMKKSLLWWKRSAIISRLVWFCLLKLSRNDIYEIVRTWERDAEKIAKMHLSLTIDP